MEMNLTPIYFSLASLAMADAEELELVRVHVSEPDCWTGCDFCCPFYDLEDIEESQWTWAAEGELELVLFGDYELDYVPRCNFSSNSFKYHVEIYQGRSSPEVQ